MGKEVGQTGLPLRVYANPSQFLVMLLEPCWRLGGAAILLWLVAFLRPASLKIFSIISY